MIERQKVLPLQAFASILSRELRQTAECWWFFTEMDVIEGAFPPTSDFCTFFYPTKHAHFRCAILGLHQSLADKDVSLTTLVKQLNSVPEHAAFRTEIVDFLNSAKPKLKGIKTIRDLVVAHWDGKNDHRDVVKGAKVEVELIDEYVDKIEALREQIAKLAGDKYSKVSRIRIASAVDHALLRT